MNESKQKIPDNIEKSPLTIQGENHNGYNPLNEKIDFLEKRIKVLGDICSELNPYAEISNDLKMKLLDYNIVDLSDPFKITNQLLMLLEDSIDELHVLKPFDDSNLSVKEIL